MLWFFNSCIECLKEKRFLSTKIQWIIAFQHLQRKHFVHVFHVSLFPMFPCHPNLSMLSNPGLQDLISSVALFLPCSTSQKCDIDLFTFTRSYAALRAADLDWIVGPGYSLGRVHSGENHEKPTWNHDKPTWNHEKPWKPTKNHEKPWNYLEKPWKPTKNHEKPWNYVTWPTRGPNTRGFSWFLVGFHGFSWFQVGLLWFQIGFSWFFSRMYLPQTVSWPDDPV